MLSATLPSARACEPEPVAVAVAAPVAAGTAAAASETVMTTSGALPGPGEWIHGAAGEPALQCHRLDQAGTAWVIRFSKWLAGEHVGTDAENTFRPAYEGNFVFLFVGSERAILFDTGPIPYEPFKEAIAEHVPNAASLDLIVAHTHSHGDHIKGDPLWEAEAAGERDSPFRSVVVVGHSPQEVADFYSLDFAPDGSCEDATTTFHLGGGRELQLFWIRGHEDSHIAVYDEVTDVLVTGDVLYPGRLYVRDTPQFAATCQRMAAFVQHLPPARRDALRVLGCHIEMSSDGGEYETGTVYQPDEAKYEMTAQDVLDLASATSGAGSGGQTSGLAEGFDPNRRFMVVPPRL